MSMRIPVFGNRSVWDDPWAFFPEQSRLFDQRFGLGLTDADFLPPLSYRGVTVRPRIRRQNSQSGTTGLSEVTNNEKEFKAMIDVSHFAPDEINVKTIDGRLVINAKHEEKEDEHGYIKREFTRQYQIPKDVSLDGMVSSLSTDGVLTVKAPKLAIDAPNERVIPIKFEGTNDMETEEAKVEKAEKDEA